MAAASTSAYTHGLAEWIAELRFEDLPANVVERVRLLVLDTIGVGMFGSALPWTRLLQTAVLSNEPPGNVSIWGTDHYVSATNAALVNSTAIHGFELDDWGVGGHSGASTVAVALAIAQAGIPITGRELIVALVAGIEGQSRIADAAGGIPWGPMHKGLGFHGPGLTGTLAAAITAGKALCLSTKEIIDAMGHAGQQAASLMFTHHGGMGKRLLAGQAARAGLFSAQLARGGFTSNDQVLEAPFGGFLSAHTGNRSPAAFFPQRLTQGLGNDWHTPALVFKLWASRGPMHGTFEAVRKLMHEQNFTAADVQSVCIRLGATAYKNVGWRYIPNDIATAQLNIRYGVAVLLLDGEVFVEQFRSDRLAAPATMEVIDRIEVLRDDAFGEEDAHVALTLRDGRFLEQGSICRGSMDVHSEDIIPITRAEVEVKFQRLTSYFWSADRSAAVHEWTTRLTEVPDVTEIASHLASIDNSFVSALGLN